MSETQPAALGIPTRPHRRGLSGAGIFAQLSFAGAVVWLVILLSGLISYTAHFGDNFYYVLIGSFLPYFAVFQFRRVSRLVFVPETWLLVFSVLAPVVLVLFGPRDYFADRVMKDRIVFTSLVLGSAAVLMGPEGRRLLRVSAALVLLFAVPVSFIEIVVPNLFSTATGRSAGLYVNPNMACAAILLCLIFVVDLARPTAKSLLVAALSIAAVFATFSRMGMIFATMLGVTYALTPRFADRGAIGAGPRAVLLAVLGVATAVIIGWVAANVELSDDAKLRLHSFFTADLSDESASGRIERAITSAKLVAERPFGWGVGAVERKELGPHNTYLYLAVDYGIPGALLFVTIMGVGFVRALRAGWRRASCAMAVVALLAFTSMFDHYVANSLYLAVGFAALMTGALIGPRAEPRNARAGIPVPNP